MKYYNVFSLMYKPQPHNHRLYRHVLEIAKLPFITVLDITQSVGNGQRTINTRWSHHAINLFNCQWNFSPFFPFFVTF